MTRVSFAFSLMVCLACQWSAAAADEKPSDKVPELKVLDRYAGSWDVVITSENPPFTNATATAKWILDGMFLQQTAEAKDGGNFKFMSLMTYDPAKKAYRSWVFLSNGAAIESEGTWNEQRQVMTSVGGKDENGAISTTTADFSEAGVEKWKIVRKDGTGSVISEMNGKNTRKKK